ncbi:MAG: sigma-70 family RNA polymerase sigma factor [Planctomycetota bacterium]|jgi:RNA polymerase sigma factor (TIGR02999 family)
MTDFTRILNAIEGGSTQAADELLPLVYEELRLLAAQRLSQERPGQTLQATALVHEAYIRLVEAKDRDWNSRGHFFKAAAEAMRRILIENARRKKRLKRGGDWQRIELGKARIELGKADFSIESTSDDLLAVNEALDKLSVEEPSVADLVKLRYFAGLTIDQVAEIQGISRRSVIDHWAYARSWLTREITKDGEAGGI